MMSSMYWTAPQHLCMGRDVHSKAADMHMHTPNKWTAFSIPNLLEQLYCFSSGPPMHSPCIEMS